MNMKHIRRILLVLVLAILTGCAGFSYPRPPMYPNAQNISVEKIESQMRVVEFDVSDNIETVMSFYNQNLTNSGWREVDNRPGSPKGGNIRTYLYITNTERPPATMFSFIIRAFPDGNGTHAEVTFAYEGPGSSWPADYQFPPGFN